MLDRIHVDEAIPSDVRNRIMRAVWVDALMIEATAAAPPAIYPAEQRRLQIS